GVPVEPAANTVAPANVAAPLELTPEQNARLALSEAVKAAWEIYRRVASHAKPAVNDGVPGEAGKEIHTPGFSHTLFGNRAVPSASIQGQRSQIGNIAQPTIQP